MPKYLANLNVNQKQLEYPVIHINSGAPTGLTATDGQMYFNSADGKMYYYSSGWTEFGTGTGSVSAVTGTEGVAHSGTTTVELTLDLASLTPTAAFATGDFIAFQDISDTGTTKKNTLTALITFLEGVNGLDHDALINWDSDEHIAHSGVSINTAANSGLGGGGNITTSRNLVLNTTNLTAHSGAPAAADTLAVYENGVGQRKMTYSTFESNLTILESQITDGSTLARIASNETISGSWTFNNVIIASSTPTLDSHLANKGYVDSVASGMDAKASVRAATTANLDLTGAETVDGVSVTTGDRVLVKNQTTTSQNGIYVASTGAWTRADDADIWDELVSAFVFVEEGTTNGDSGWLCTVDPGGTLNTTTVTWVQFSGAGQITAGTGLTKDGNTIHIGNGNTENRNGIAFSADDIAVTLTTNGGLVFLSNQLRVNLSATNMAGALARADIAAATANYVVINDGSGNLSQEASLDATRGGTEQTAVATGDLLYGSGADVWSRQTIGAVGNVLRVQSGTPQWGAIDLAATNAVGSSILGVTNGGTGVNASTTLAGQILIGNATNNDFDLTTLTQGTGIDITNADGSITIALDEGTDGVQSIARKYTGLCGNGTATQSISHGLATNFVTVQVFEVSTGDKVECDVNLETGDTDDVTLSFALPYPTSNSLRIVVTG